MWEEVGEREGEEVRSVLWEEVGEGEGEEVKSVLRERRCLEGKKKREKEA